MSRDDSQTTTKATHIEKQAERTISPPVTSNAHQTACETPRQKTIRKAQELVRSVLPTATDEEIGGAAVKIANMMLRLKVKESRLGRSA